jgi:hypothetical protein
MGQDRDEPATSGEYDLFTAGAFSHLVPSRQKESPIGNEMDSFDPDTIYSHTVSISTSLGYNRYVVGYSNPFCEVNHFESNT